ncbi:MAG: CAP domain-containing protein [Myxococcota bacterium]
MRVFLLVVASVSLACASTARPASTDSTPQRSTPVRSGSGLATPTIDARSVQALVEEHNRARAAVGVPALQWSADIAAVAQEWADRLAKRGCDLEHSSGDLGENLYWSSDPRPAAEAVTSWVDERADYDARRHRCKRGAVCGHYTQVVWKTSRAVGCGVASCGSARVWVCNYDPPGNYVGQAPF